MSELERPYFKSSTNDMLKALNGEEVQSNPLYSEETNALISAMSSGGGGGGGLPEGYPILTTQLYSGEVETQADPGFTTLDISSNSGFSSWNVKIDGEETTYESQSAIELPAFANSDNTVYVADAFSFGDGIILYTDADATHSVEISKTEIDENFAEGVKVSMSDYPFEQTEVTKYSETLTIIDSTGGKSTVPTDDSLEGCNIYLDGKKLSHQGELHWGYFDSETGYIYSFVYGAYTPPYYVAYITDENGDDVLGEHSLLIATSITKVNDNFENATGIFTATLTNNSGTYTCDKTWEQIIEAAVGDGKQVIFREYDGEEYTGIIYNFSGYFGSGGNNWITANAIQTQTDVNNSAKITKVDLTCVTMYDDESIIVESETIWTPPIS